MGTSLFNTTPAATYPALIKVGDNTFIDGTLKTLSDGAGNDLPIQVSSTVTNFTGNVGFGTATPTNAVSVERTTGNSILSVQGNAGTFIIVSRFSNNTTRPRLELYKSRGTIAAPLVVQTNDEMGSVDFYGYDGSANQRVGILFVQADSVSGSTITPSMAFGLGTSAGANQFRMVIKNDGNITIGNSLTTLDARLGIKGGGSTSATTSLLVQNSGATTSMIVRDDGNVGIGTTNPFALLTVGGQSSFYSVQSAGTGSDFFYSDINPNLTAGANNQVVSLVRLRDRGQANTGGFTGTQRLSLIMENVAGGQFPFQLFSESGALRIGHSSVATPTALVHLKGTGSTAATTPLLIENSAGTQTFKVEDGGVVQIGLTSFITWTFSSNTLSSSQFAFINSSNGSILTSGGASGGVFGNNDGGKVADSGISVAQVASAVLEVSSTTKGFLPPRMTTAERVAISSPANGLIVFDTDVQNLCYRRDSTWVQVSFTAV